MKKIFIPFFLFGFIHFSFGQITKVENKLTTILKADLGFQGVGITYEPRLSNSITTDLSLGVGGGYDIAEGSIEYQLSKPALYLSATPKFFYNVKRRNKQGKNILNNSADYIGFRIKYSMPLYTKNDIIRNSILTNVHWGIQRCISNNWSISTQIGVGYAQDIDYGFGTIYPALDFKFSYNFPKLK